MKRLCNNKGSIVLVATGILYVLIVTAAGFTYSNIAELNNARRYYHSAAAFWLAEAGANMYMANPSMLDQNEQKEIAYGKGTILLTKDDSRPMYRLIYSKGMYGQNQRKIQLVYPANIPEVYKHVLSTQGDISIDGKKVSVLVNGQTAVSGDVGGTAKKADVLFEDIEFDAASEMTGLSYPEGGGSSFESFVQSNRNLLQNYSPDEVLHIKSYDAQALTAEQVRGKKIVFIEGNEGGGDASITSNGFLSDNQSLTVISTGTVTLNQNGFQASNSQLNIISWSGYKETVSAPSTFRGMIFTQGEAVFDDIKDSSVSYGTIVANSGIVFNEVWSTKIFNYADMTTNGYYPAGFEALKGGSYGGVVLKPIAWKEVSL